MLTDTTLNFMFACIKERVRQSLALDLKERFDVIELITDEVNELSEHFDGDYTIQAVESLHYPVSSFLSEVS